MKVTVLYFAALRERVGRAREECELPAGVDTVDGLRAWLVTRGEPWAGAFAATKHMRAAVDQSMADGHALLRDNAEVAFFPPVTGG
ncbi:MAG: molybdopterin converting factor subunit 1 [Betaproteobacteria bacterium]